MAITETSTKSPKDNKKTYNGQVKWFDFHKGYGFILKNIENNDPVEIFVHFSKIKTSNEFKMLYQGEHVEFEETDCPNKGIQADNVRAPFKAKLMHEFKSEHSQMPQRYNSSYNNYYNSNWSNNTSSSTLKGLFNELDYVINNGKGKGKNKGGKKFGKNK